MPLETGFSLSQPQKSPIQKIRKSKMQTYLIFHLGAVRRNPAQTRTSRFSDFQIQAEFYFPINRSFRIFETTEQAKHQTIGDPTIYFVHCPLEVCSPRVRNLEPSSWMFCQETSLSLRCTPKRGGSHFNCTGRGWGKEYLGNLAPPQREREMFRGVGVKTQPPHLLQPHLKSFRGYNFLAYKGRNEDCYQRHAGRLKYLHE